MTVFVYVRSLLSTYWGRRWPLCFADNVYFFIFQHRISKVAWSIVRQTLPHVWWWLRFLKFGQKLGAPPKKNRDPKRENSGFLDFIANISGAQRDMVRLKTTLTLRSDLSYTCLLNLVNFGLQMTKNSRPTRVYTQQDGGHYAGLCYALSFVFVLLTLGQSGFLFLYYDVRSVCWYTLGWSRWV